MTTRILALSFVVALATGARAELTYVKDIKPIFEKHCTECHGAKKAKGTLRLDTKEHVYGGDVDNEYAVVPGKPDESKAYTLLVTKDEDDLMPPPDSDAPKMNAADIEKVKAWIAGGAAWDAGDKPVNTPNVRKKEKKS